MLMLSVNKLILSSVEDDVSDPCVARTKPKFLDGRFSEMMCKIITPLETVNPTNPCVCVDP